MKDRNLKTQFGNGLQIYIEGIPSLTNTEPENPTDAAELDRVELVSFRELVPEINDTGYLTHAIFAYPAKFIPQVVRYAINTYTKEGDWIIDPFAGSGTVGVEAYLCKRNAVLLDLNPLLNHIMPLKVYRGEAILSDVDLYKLLDGMRGSTHRFIPAWSNVDYWYAPEILDVLSRYWGFINNTDGGIYSTLIKSALLKVRNVSLTQKIERLNSPDLSVS